MRRIKSINPVLIELIANDTQKTAEKLRHVCVLFYEQCADIHEKLVNIRFKEEAWGDDELVRKPLQPLQKEKPQF